MDCYGHGTHVAGTIGGYGVTANGSRFSGPYNSSTAFAALAIGPGVAPLGRALCPQGLRLHRQQRDRRPGYRMGGGSQWGRRFRRSHGCDQPLAWLALRRTRRYNDGCREPGGSRRGRRGRFGWQLRRQLPDCRVAVGGGPCHQCCSHPTAGEQRSQRSVLGRRCSQLLRARSPAHRRSAQTRPGGARRQHRVGSGRHWRRRTLALRHFHGRAPCGRRRGLAQGTPSNWTVEELKALLMNTALPLAYAGAAPYAALACSSPPRVGAGRIDLQQAAATAVVAMNADEPGQVSLSFGAPTVQGAYTAVHNIRSSTRVLKQPSSPHPTSQPPICQASASLRRQHPLPCLQAVAPSSR